MNKQPTKDLVSAAQKAFDALYELKSEAEFTQDKEIIQAEIDECFKVTLELLGLKVCECGDVARAGEMKANGGLCKLCKSLCPEEPQYEPQFSGKF